MGDELVCARLFHKVLSLAVDFVALGEVSFGLSRRVECIKLGVTDSLPVPDTDLFAGEPRSRVVTGLES